MTNPPPPPHMKLEDFGCYVKYYKPETNPVVLLISQQCKFIDESIIDKLNFRPRAVVSTQELIEEADEDNSVLFEVIDSAKAQTVCDDSQSQTTEKIHKRSCSKKKVHSKKKLSRSHSRRNHRSSSPEDNASRSSYSLQRSYSSDDSVKEYSCSRRRSSRSRRRSYSPGEIHSSQERRRKRSSHSRERYVSPPDRRRRYSLDRRERYISPPDRRERRSQDRRRSLSYHREKEVEGSSRHHKQRKRTSRKSPLRSSSRISLPLRSSSRSASPEVAAGQSVTTKMGKKIAIQDDYSKMLVEEMNKRDLLKDPPPLEVEFVEKNIDADRDPIENLVLTTPKKKSPAKVVRLPTLKKITPAKKTPVEAKILSPEEQSLHKYELGIVSKDMPPEEPFPQEKFLNKEPAIKEEFDYKGQFPNSYYCNLCQLGLNSELTWQSHVQGKKHAKMLNLRDNQAIAKGVKPAPSVSSTENAPRFGNAPTGYIRVPISIVPRLQTTVDNTTHAVPGLEFIQEIHMPKDLHYYCEICDAPCQIASIMQHLTGFKHQLNCVKTYFNDFYERNKNRQDRSFKGDISNRLYDYELKRGRGQIKVLQERKDPSYHPEEGMSFDNPGPSNWRGFKRESQLADESRDTASPNSISHDNYLDMSKGDFCCTLCDAHMNNKIMWKQHIIGKRHLTNVKKNPGESISKKKAEKISDKSKLEERIDIECPDEIVVGLDFIQERRSPTGNMYNCFLCGSCSTDYDIIDHLLLIKHRFKYLENLYISGKNDEVGTLINLEIKDTGARNSLINDQCYQMEKKFGRGKVSVYAVK